MNTKKCIGFVLLLVAAGIIVFSLIIKKQTDNAFDVAKNEVLLTVSGKTPGKAGSFQVSYIHSHGTTISNAETVFQEGSDSANVELIRGEEIILLQFKKGVETRGGGSVGSINQVIVKSPFDGEMLFKYGVCGCEKIGPSILVFIAGGVGLILSVIGLLLILKKKDPIQIDSSIADSATAKTE